MKIDLRKAYDSVEWGFLQSLLLKLGIPYKFGTWVMECVTSVSYVILLNGGLTPHFKAEKGLRQGDSMSSYLFVIVMEYLNSCLRQLHSNSNFNFHPRCEKLGIFLAFLAYDLLMFYRADMGSIQLLMEAFYQFTQVSGLEPNMDKSQLHITGVSHEEKLNLIQAIGFTMGDIPFKYLGVPLSSKTLTFMQCMPIVEHMVARIKCWTSKFLSYGGKLQMIMSLLFGMQTYWAQVFVLPKKIIKSVEVLTEHSSGHDNISCPSEH